jgi:hypothetical protein
MRLGLDPGAEMWARLAGIVEAPQGEWGRRAGQVSKDDWAQAWGA